MRKKFIKKYPLIRGDTIYTLQSRDILSENFFNLSALLMDCSELMTHESDKLSLQEASNSSGSYLPLVLTNKCFDFKSFNEQGTFRNEHSGLLGDGVTLERVVCDGQCYLMTKRLSEKGSTFLLTLVKENPNGTQASSLIFFVSNLGENEIEVVFDLEANRALGFDNGCDGVVDWNTVRVRQSLAATREAYAEFFHELFKVYFGEYNKIRGSLNQEPLELEVKKL